MPVTCACGKSNSMNHVLSCCKGGYVIMQQNEIRNITASLLEGVTVGVENEPMLQPLHERRRHA